MGFVEEQRLREVNLDIQENGGDDREANDHTWSSLDMRRRHSAPPTSAPPLAPCAQRSRVSTAQDEALQEADTAESTRLAVDDLLARCG